MAISGFGRGKGEGSTAAPTVSSSTGQTGGFGNLTAFIDQGSEFEGKLSFKDTVRIDGTFSGEISSDNTLIVGETGQIMASIHSVCVVISGLVEGNVHASESIVLHKTACVNGDLESPTVVMEEGAQLNGMVRMGRSASGAGKGDAGAGSASGKNGSAAGKSGDKSGAPDPA